MPIVKTLTTPNGATAVFHKALSASVDLAAGSAIVQVASWPTEQTHNDGLGLIWSWPVQLLPADLSRIDAALVAQSGGTFSGGATVADASGGIESVKARKWSQIKDQRSAIEYGTFTWDGSTFDCDPVSTSRIMGAFSLAMAALSASQPYSETWVLADNTTRDLSAADMLAVGATLGAQVSAAFATANTLRAAIEAATTIADVESISWP